MLPPDYFINNLDEITVLYSDLHTSILESMARRAAATLKATGSIGLMPSLVTQMEHAQAAGLIRADIAMHIAATLRVSVDVMTTLFDDAGVKTLFYDNEVYRAAGLPDVVIRQSPILQHILESGINKQMGLLQRLTGTIAINSQQLFERILNTAYNQVVSGTQSYTEALRDSVDAMLKDGVSVFNYESGRKISVEAAVLMNLRTGVSQTAGEISHTAMIERGAPCCETSAHIGARNTGKGFVNHELWQGRVFSLYGKTDTYDDFVTECGYGNVRGIYGVNCRHSHRPFYPGITEPRWTPEKLQEYASKQYSFTNAAGEQNTVDAYAASQVLRGLEREIRAWKRRISVNKAAGVTETAAADKKKLKYWQARVSRFCEETGIKRQHFRERI